MTEVNEIAVKNSKNMSYFDISNYLVNVTSIDEVQASSYNSFIDNVIPKYMGEVYKAASSREDFTITFDKWWLSHENVLPEDMCRELKESQEVTLKGLMRVEYKDSFYPKDEDIATNSVVHEVEITRFPYLNEKGYFMINGVPKVLIGFLAAADKIVLTSLKGGAASKKKGKELRFEGNTGSGPYGNSIIMNSLGIRINGGYGHTANLSFKKALSELGFEEYFAINKITGENPLILNHLTDPSKNNASTNQRENLSTIINRYQLNSDYQRRHINIRLSFMENIIGKELAEPVLTYSKGHVVTIEDAIDLTVSGVTNLSIIHKGLRVPIQSNGFAPLKEVLKKFNLPTEIVPDNMIRSTAGYLKREFIESNGQGPATYSWVNVELFNKLYNDAMHSGEFTDKELQIKALKSSMAIHSSNLKGETLTKEDVLGMINLYSRYTMGVEEESDIDSLEFKRIIYVSEVFEEGLNESLRGIVSAFEKTKLDCNGNKNGVRILKKEHKAVFGNRTITDLASRNPLYNSLDTTNPLAQINNKRKITSQHTEGYIGGVRKDSTDTRQRSVNHSFPGRLDVIETPESQSVGLVRHISALAYLNTDRELEVPFLKIDKENKKIDLSTIYYMTYDQERKHSRILSPKICKRDGIKIDFYRNQNVVHSEFIEMSTENMVNMEPYTQIALRSLSKYDADDYKIAVHRKNWFEKEDNLVFHVGEGETREGTWRDIDLISVSGSHIFSPVSASIPFIEFDDASRAMMGSVMGKQAISIWGKEKQQIFTPMSKTLSKKSSGVILAPFDCEVVDVDSMGILIKDMEDGTEKYIPTLQNERTSKTTLNKSIPTVKTGDIMLKDEIIADSSSTINGELTHGTNMLIGYMPMDGHNYEDAILINERLVKDDTFSSFHIDEYDMTMSVEEGKKDRLYDRYVYDKSFSANPSDMAILSESNKHDSHGIIKEGSEVTAGDILMCKITPRNTSKGKKEKLLTIKYKESTPGIVVEVAIIKNQNNMIKVKIATRLKISVGDKFTGRHGNKGVISKIVPEADMPYLENGRRLDICLTPLGIPSRMNLGQVLEGLAGLKLQSAGIRGEVDQMSGFEIDRFRTVLQDESGTDKKQLYNPKTGRPYTLKTMVVLAYIVKLEHIASQKIHARGFGTPDCTYSLNKQPLQGKASNGGQRIGEMEFWMFQDHGCGNIQKELVQYRSDDDVSRAIYKDYEAERVANPDTEIEDFSLPSNVPYAFRSITALFRGMYKSMEYYDKDGNRIDPDTPTVEMKFKGIDPGKKVLDRNYERQLQTRLGYTPDEGTSEGTSGISSMDEDDLIALITGTSSDVLDERTLFQSDLADEDDTMESLGDSFDFSILPAISDEELDSMDLGDQLRPLDEDGDIIQEGQEDDMGEESNMAEIGNDDEEKSGSQDFTDESNCYVQEDGVEHCHVSNDEYQILEDELFGE